MEMRIVMFLACAVALAFLSRVVLHRDIQIIDPKGEWDLTGTIAQGRIGQSADTTLEGINVNCH